MHFPYPTLSGCFVFFIPLAHLAVPAIETVLSPIVAGVMASLHFTGRLLFPLYIPTLRARGATSMRRSARHMGLLLSSQATESGSSPIALPRYYRLILPLRLLL